MSKEEYSFHLNKIQNFSKKFNEQRLMEKKISTSLCKSTDQEESCELPSIDINFSSPNISQIDIIEKITEEKSSNMLASFDLKDKIAEYKN